MDHIQGSDLHPEQLISTAQLVARGMTTHDIVAVRSGELVRLRRGTYVVRLPDEPSDRHRLLVAATLGELREPTIVSHFSAAVWHGLEVPWGALEDRVHVTRELGGESRRAKLISHVGTVPAEHAIVRDGCRLTSVPWTVVDCTRLLGFARGLVVADSALRLHGGDTCPREALVSVLLAHKGKRGIAAARAAVAHASPLAESGGESVSRAVLMQQGLPDPVLQYEIRTDAGEFVARTDMAWPAARTVGELDGALKYRRGMTRDADPGRVVYREKRREDAIRRLGWEVVRWGWEDLDDPSALAARIMAVLRRGLARRRVVRRSTD